MADSELNSFKGKLMNVYNHALLLANMHVGDQRGLYAALKGNNLTAGELATSTACDLRYIEDWLVNQTINGIITRNGEDGPTGSGTYTLSEAQALCLATPSGPHDMSGAIQCITGTLNQIDEVSENFSSGNGIPWSKQNPHVHAGCRRFFAPLYQYLLTSSIIPATGMQEALTEGRKVADIGCGHGISTITMAKAFPNSTFFGFDYDSASITYATNSNSNSNASFTTESAVNVAADEKFDMISVFDCFHDMNNPEGAIKHFAEILKDEGCVLLIEPSAGETINDNNNLVGQVYSGFSAICCLQCAKHDSQGSSLGTIAPTSKIEKLFLNGGFKSFELVTVPEAAVNRVFLIKK